MFNNPYLINKNKKHSIIKAILTLIILITFLVIPYKSVLSLTSPIKDVLILEAQLELLYNAHLYYLEIDFLFCKKPFDYLGLVNHINP